MSLVRYFCHTQGGKLGDLGFEFFLEMRRLGLSIRVVPCNHYVECERWSGYEEYFKNEVDANFLNVVCGDRADFARFYTAGYVNVALGTDRAPDRYHLSLGSHDLHRLRELRTSVLFVGEDNPYGSDPRFALYPRPEGASGDRLRKILGLSLDEYMSPSIQRTNMCSRRWNKEEALLKIKELRGGDPYRLVVLLGAKNRDVMGISKFFDSVQVPVTCLALPHPSGLNRRMWNPEVVDRARRMLTGYAPHVPWGSA